MAKLNDKGHEILDNTPVAIPVGWKRPESLQEQMRRMIRTELSQAAANEGFETFEESEDFDVEDDAPDPQSQWEIQYEPNEPNPASEPDRGHPGGSEESGKDGSGKPGPGSGDPTPPGPGKSDPQTQNGSANGPANAGAPGQSD